MLLGRHTWARELTTLESKLVYHAILTYALRDSISFDRN